LEPDHEACPPVHVVALFSAERELVLRTLESLTPDEWLAPPARATCASCPSKSGDRVLSTDVADDLDGDGVVTRILLFGAI
jgi:hypothetical protein